MCLAIYCPAGKTVSTDHLLEAYRNNPHGAGFSFFDQKGKVQTRRFMKFDEFLDSYENAKEKYGDKSPFSIHFRYATHGKTDVNNVHPFMYGGNTSVIHNGILPAIIDDPDMSDTASFVENYLAALPREWYDNEYLFQMVEEYCAGSKLVILTANPRAEYCAYIVNEGSGHWAEGVWYSNSSYCKTKPKKGFVTTSKPVLTGTQQSLEDEADDYYSRYDDAIISKCELCDEEAVIDGICYYCATCQSCMMEEEYCWCEKSIHSMTDEQFKEAANE